MHSEEELITPEKAYEYLLRNTVNRKLSMQTIRNYAHDMKAGKWELNEQGISFYEDGTLANGQHRLNAIIKAGIPVKIYVTRDVPKESFVRDRGRVRTQANVFEMQGLKISSLEIGAVNFMFTISGKNHLSDQTVLEFCDENCEFLQKARMLSTHGSTKPIGKKSPIVAALFVALNCGVPESELDSFMNTVNTGLYESKAETAAQILRNHIIDYGSLARDTTGRKKMFFKALCAIKDYTSKKSRTRQYPDDCNSTYWNYVKEKIVDKYINSYSSLSK